MVPMYREPHITRFVWMADMKQDHLGIGRSRERRWTSFQKLGDLGELG